MKGTKRKKDEDEDEKGKKVALWLPADAYARVERVQEAMKQANMGAGVSMSHVFRLALLHGLKVLEGQFGVGSER